MTKFLSAGSSIVCTIAVLFLSVQNSIAQSFAFGVKGGPSLCIQKWNGYNGREPLIRLHGIVFIESHSDEHTSSLFLQAGHHVRGSALRQRAYYNTNIMDDIEARTSHMEFKNISLAVGAKKRFEFGNNKAYYLIGLRGEYTYDTDFEGYLEIYEGLQNKALFGASVGGGIEFPFSRYISGILEASILPDFSKQIFIPYQDTGYTFSNGQPWIIQEQNVTNVSIEISLGIRFLREITYYD